MNIRSLEKRDLGKNPDDLKSAVRSKTAEFLSRLLENGDGIWHSFDFSKYDAGAVYEAALGNVHCLASLQNESLFA